MIPIKPPTPVNTGPNILPGVTVANAHAQTTSSSRSPLQPWKKRTTRKTTQSPTSSQPSTLPPSIGNGGYSSSLHTPASSTTLTSHGGGGLRPTNSYSSAYSHNTSSYNYPTTASYNSHHLSHHQGVLVPSAPPPRPATGPKFGASSSLTNSTHTASPGPNYHDYLRYSSEAMSSSSYPNYSFYPTTSAPPPTMIGAPHRKSQEGWV